MEIEAKFAVPDLATFQRLQAAAHIAGFSLSAHQVQQVQDTYMDTEGRLILASGYACRRRVTESEVLVTLKGLGRAQGAIHRRRELEISLPTYEPGQELPESPVRDLILQVTGGRPLTPLFDLRQTRVFRRMRQGELLVAQFSLDNVRIVANKKRMSHFELEVELAPQGTANDMRAIVAYLQDEWSLMPEPLSKFERALAFLDEDRPGGDLLTAQERAICVQIARRRDLYGRRARGLVLLDEGVPPPAIATRVDRTPRTVRRWLSTFEDERLASFPDRVLQAVQSTSAAILPQVPSPKRDVREQEEAPSPEPEPQPLRALFKRYLVDQVHVRNVADHALALFDHLRQVHGLPQRRRSLLETAALVHNIGVASHSDRQQSTDRDILLAYPPEELDAEERLMVALTAYLHRGQLRSEELDRRLSEDPFTELSKRARREALVVSSLLRMADGLDYSETQSTEMEQIAQRDDLIDVRVAGPYAALDAAQAQEKSDLWQLLFEPELRFSPAHLSGELVPRSEEGEDSDATIDLMPDELPEYPGLLPDDTMAEAARKILTFHFQHMLCHEEGTRVGEDIEELHDMRVATRRMRAAFEVFGSYVDQDRLDPMRKGARRTGNKLGTVRDLDVFWERTQRYLDGLPPERKNELISLREAWEAEREQAREEMLAYLDGDRYAQFRKRSAELLRSPDAWGLPALTKKGEAVPRRLRHVVPSEIYERVACVLAYDEWVTESGASLKQLHRLRIAGKRLRYTLEFFEEILAPQTADLIGRMKELQDHLGDLQDAVVASELLRDFLTWGTWGEVQGKKRAKVPPEPIVAPSVAVYLADKQAELQRLLRTFPDVWAYFASPEFKQTVAVIVAPL